MSRKPNLLLIMCDQLRYDVLGCYGNKLVQTPNIDRLARMGVIFDQAYSQTPVCVPARHGLISGLNPFEIGLLKNEGLSKEIEAPLPELIREQGYHTCAVGKMHFHPARRHYGFNRMLLSEEVPSHFDDDEYLQFLRDQGYGHVLEPHGKRSELYYVPQISELPEHLHTSAWTADTTCSVIRQNRNRPFFLFSSFIKPHPPFDPCVPYDTMYAPDQVPPPKRREHERTSDDAWIDVMNDYKVNGIDSLSREDELKMRAYYYGCVSQMDKQIGKILDTLESCSLIDDTLIVFTADHGEMLGDHYSYGKRTYYEMSAKVPLIISWPGSLPQGERRDQLALLQDIYATFISAAGGKVPAESSGVDLQPAAEGQEGHTREKIFAEIGRGRLFKTMLRWDRYKYIYHANGGKENLFDLLEDPDEFNDISAEHPELCRDCREQLEAYYSAHGLEEALDGDGLARYDETEHVPRGYLDQSPKWPSTVVAEME
ncbi:MULTISPECIES: sulfatase family protein [Paenibacillus]|uniref:sulfatase family protein n=1 Tax=Paenibacillus TaxID=44249 RepID=UPI0011A1477F|nr:MULTISPECIES: sulfatase-like hydrolase/transferase [Paenibacillus]MBJ9992303.1 sulfatase-like hydrolase/transferase [Paenibacillus sp. S28]